MNEEIFQKVIEVEKELDKKYKNHPNISFLSGMGGLPIFYFLLFKLTSKKQYLSKLHKSLDRIFAQLNNIDNIGFGYCTGLSGISYMLNFLLKNEILEEEDIKESLNIMDNAIMNYSLNNLYTIEDTDFLHGGLGTAHYLIERLDYNTTLRIRTVELLEKIAQIVLDDLIKYDEICNSKIFSDSAHRTNCGLAHGYIAHIIIFSKFLEYFPNNVLVKKALEKSVKCILSFESSDSSTLSMFPGIAINKHLANYNVPLGWCYGDQSIAFGLYKASKVLNDRELLKKSRGIVRKTLQKDNLEKSVNNIDICDSSFCHGIVSIGYLHKKSYKITNDEKCLDIYKYFTNQLLQKSTGHTGLEGHYRFDLQKGFIEDFTFLNGLIGVGVFFIDYLLNDDNIKWDGIFLLD